MESGVNGEGPTHITPYTKAALPARKGVCKDMSSSTLIRSETTIGRPERLRPKIGKKLSDQTCDCREAEDSRCPKSSNGRRLSILKMPYTETGRPKCVRLRGNGSGPKWRESGTTDESPSLERP